MFVDASVIVAILGREDDGEAWAERLRGGDIEHLYISPLVRFESVAALARIKSKERGADVKPSRDTVLQAAAAFDALTDWMGAQVVDVSADIGAGAVEASSVFGKVVGHPAALNFGDCFAYACAKSLGVPLAYKGDDFARTDLARVPI